jgi:hypothetical protein
VLDWLRDGKNTLPSYSLLEEQPTRCLPPELVDSEDSDDYRAWSSRVQADMFASRTDLNLPYFAIFLKGADGLLQLPHPETGSRILLVFSARYKASDYARVQVPKLKLELFCSSPTQAAQVIPHFHQHASITYVALDRCPRCPVFALLDAAALNDPEQIVKFWKISKSTEFCRLELYWTFARDQANSGKLVVARDLALEIVGHVNAEDPRPHLLLGKLAIRLRDRQLLREARQFLEFFRFAAAAHDLDAATKTDQWQF